MVKFSRKPRLGVLQRHPAPYRDPVFARVHERSRVDLQVLFMFDEDLGHRYRPKEVLHYPHRFLGKCLNLGRHHFFHPRILRELVLGRYDVLLVPGWRWYNSRLALSFAWLTDTPIIFCGDAVLFPRNYAVYREKLRDWFLRNLLKHVAATWVPGKAGQEYMEHYGLSQDQIFQGLYCLDLDVIVHAAEAARPRRREIRSTLGVEEEDWLYLFVGRMLPFRGVPYLVDAFAQLSREHPEIKLVLIGDGVDRAGLEAEKNKRDLTGLIFLDPVPMDRLTDYYVAADAYVTPALREHYSLALAQAAICGLPMISTDRVGAYKDYVIAGLTGHIVPPGDRSALCQAMLGLATQREAARTWGQKAASLSTRRTTSWAAEQLEAAVFTAMEAAARRRRNA